MRPCQIIKPLSNGVTLEYTHCGSIYLIPELQVYYNPQSIVNLLSMSVVTSKYCVTMENGGKDVIVIHSENNQEIKPNRYGHGLY